MGNETPLPKRPKRPQFERAEAISDDWQPTARDEAIVVAVHEYDGFLADYQIRRLFFGNNKSLTQPNMRTRLLFDHQYLRRFNRVQRAIFGFMGYWLDERGANLVAKRKGIPLRELHWRAKIKKDWVLHDVAVNDVRIAIEEACHLRPQLVLEQWVVQGTFWRPPLDRVDYVDVNGTSKTHGMRPDGLFSIVDTQSRYRWRFLLEVDRNSEDEARIGREKILAGLSYLKSEAYKRRAKSERAGGYWLLVTTSERRMRNMKLYAEDIIRQRVEATMGKPNTPQQEERVVAAVTKQAKSFLFTTFDAVTPETILTAPVWYCGGENALRSLLEK